jgi:hypothetical protein
MCALCLTIESNYIGCVCEKCYREKILPLKKTKLKKKIPDSTKDW